MEKLGEVDYKMDRAIIFVDHANIFYNLQERNIRIDFSKLKKVLSEDSYLVGEFAYLGMPEKVPDDKKNFLLYDLSNL